jgi:TatD DNase family protein
MESSSNKQVAGRGEWSGSYSLTDVHAHAYEYSSVELGQIEKEGIRIISVAEDLESSYTNISLSEEHYWIKPCIGVHPWNVSKTSVSVLKEIEKIVSRNEIACMGEIGLDTKFVPQSIDRQREFFVTQLKIGKEYGLPFNLHAAGTWTEVFDLLVKMDIDRAVFHWYTGPIDLLEKIGQHGYYISINPSIKIQEKHQKVAEEASLDMILVESDGPYTYRGLRLNSLMIKETIKLLSKLKKVEEHYLLEKLDVNTTKIFPSITR